MPQVLRPVDVVLACRAHSLSSLGRSWSCADVGRDLGVSTSTAYLAADRCRRSQLILPSGKVSPERLRDSLLYAVPLLCPASYEGPGRGTPTATSAAFAADAGMFERRPDIPLVWGSDGGTRGILVAPLHPSVPALAAEDRLLYELLALADVMRLGGEADKKLAVKYVGIRLGRPTESRG
jgi:hypothetical protein